MLVTLFVDDDPMVLAGLRRLLHGTAGLTMVTAGGGVEALQILEARPIQAIVSDKKMPDMDGLDLLDQVKALYPHIVRVLLSGSILSERIPDHRMLTKPCSREALLAAIGIPNVRG
jgi:CheY-like chemotaxis protein